MGEVRRLSTGRVKGGGRLLRLRDSQTLRDRGDRVDRGAGKV